MGSLPISVLGAGTTGSGGETRSAQFRRIAYEDGRTPSILNPSKERNRLTPSLKERCGAKRANSRLNSSGSAGGPSSTAPQPLFSAHCISTAVSPTNQTSSPGATPLSDRARWTGSQDGLSAAASPAPTTLPKNPDQPSCSTSRRSSGPVLLLTTPR